jgi:hypothetical protein
MSDEEVWLEALATYEKLAMGRRKVELTSIIRPILERLQREAPTVEELRALSCRRRVVAPDRPGRVSRSAAPVGQAPHGRRGLRHTLQATRGPGAGASLVAGGPCHYR